MSQPTVRIYLTANSMIYLFFALAFFPEGLLVGIMAIIFSTLFSVVTLPLLWGYFSIVKRYRPNLTCSWITLFLMVAICASVTLLVTGILGIPIIDDGFFVGLSFGSAFLSALFQYRYINQYFQSIQHETELLPENN